MKRVSKELDRQQLEGLGWNGPGIVQMECNENGERIIAVVPRGFGKDHPDIEVCVTYDLLAEWLREDKGIAINITADTRGQYQWSAVLLPSAQCQDPISTDLRLHDSYNDAMGAAVRSVLNQLTKEL